MLSIHSFSHFNLGTGILPESACCLAVVGVLWQLPSQSVRYLELHKHKTSDGNGLNSTERVSERNATLVGAGATKLTITVIRRFLIWRRDPAHPKVPKLITEDLDRETILYAAGFDG